MDQRMLRALCRIIVGPTGRRLPAYPDIQAAYQGLFADYYRYNPYVSIKTCYKYANASTPYPHFLCRHYDGPKGYSRTLSDVMGVADDCTSITLLRQIQDEVFQWAMAYLPDDESADACKHYVIQNATRRDIAVYLADMLHLAITRDSVENNPSEIEGQP